MRIFLICLYIFLGGLSGATWAYLSNHGLVPEWLAVSAALITAACCAVVILLTVPRDENP